jgi:hypothetical protein
MFGALCGPNESTPTRSKRLGVFGASKPRIHRTCGVADAAEVKASIAPALMTITSAIRRHLSVATICDTA